MGQRKIRRGDIYCADLNPVVGSEQGGDRRPVIVVQNNDGNEHSPTVVVVPVTATARKYPLPTHVPVPGAHGLDRDSTALAEQIRTLDRSRLAEHIGRIDAGLQPAIDRAIAACTGLGDRSALPGEMLILSLCHRCEVDFRKSGYLLVKRGWQEVRDMCDFCKADSGLTFGVFNLWRDGQWK